MNKNTIFYLASTILLASGFLASCGNKKQNDSLKEEATQEVFITDEKTTAIDSIKDMDSLKTDSLKQIEEMVKAVESPVNGINGTKYNAAFFNNDNNKGTKATADKYAQTASGLKYVIAKEGKGKSPNASDKVTVHYVGTLTDGTTFDSSIDRGEPIDFPLSGVIPGWTEGLQLMREGGEAVFYIPSNLAYGERGIQNPMTGEYTIPPSSPLIFWVQLIQVN